MAVLKPSYDELAADLERYRRLVSRYRRPMVDGGITPREKIACAKQRMDDAEAEVERLRGALAFYANSDHYEWRDVVKDEPGAEDWTDEDRACSNSTDVLLDSGARARAALRG